MGLGLSHNSTLISSHLSGSMPITTVIWYIWLSPDIPDCRTCYEIKEEGERRPYASLGAEAGHADHAIAECLKLHGRMDGLTPRTARWMCPIWTFGST